VPCDFPLSAGRSKVPDPATGKHTIAFSPKFPSLYDGISLPCGQCTGCRIDYSRSWAARCVFEASLHEKNCFITLTFDDEHLPPGGSLTKHHFVNFMKRLRERFVPVCPYTDEKDPRREAWLSEHGIRFYHAAEYGEQFGRPHHHAILFNFDFPDKYLWTVENGNCLYRSPILEKLWTFGFSSVGDVSFESCAYVARYVMKKITGKTAPDHYQGRLPEYCTMSRVPGLASDWIQKHASNIFVHDLLVLPGGKQMKFPKYFEKKYEVIDPNAYKKLKEKRIDYLSKKDPINPDRLTARAVRREKRVQRLVRSYEGTSSTLGPARLRAGRASGTRVRIAQTRRSTRTRKKYVLKIGARKP